MNYHSPVLLKETISSLSIIPNGVYIDATLGHGGHTIEILKQNATVYGFDQDSKNIEIATQRINSEKLEKKFFAINQNFINIKSFLKKQKINKIDGLIADLGLSQNQQTGQDRGFSFNDPLSLDMRLNPKTQTLSAENIINTWDKDQLYEIFTKYAQEKLAKPLIYEIIQARQIHPIKTALELSHIIENYYHKKNYSTYHHPATKIFLALRIAVNHELDNLKKILTASLKITKPGARVAIISFHSGEDRITKQFIVKNHLVTQKFIPKHVEVKKNPLSRSAILRFYKIT